MTTTSGLGVQTGANLAANDLIGTVDVSDTSMSASGTNKSITVTELKGGLSFNERGVIVANSVYNPWDITTYKGARILCTKTFNAGAAPVFVSSVNYIRLTSFTVVNVDTLDMTGNQASAASNNTILQAALNEVNPTNASGAGGIVQLPRGVGIFTGDLDVPNGVWVRGNGTFGTWMQLLDGMNPNPLAMFKPHKSTGAGNKNAFFWHISDMTIDMRAIFSGTKLTDVSVTSGSTTITSASRAWVDNEFVRGSGVDFDSQIVAGSQAGSGPYTATMSKAAQQTLTGNTVYCSVTQGCGIYSEAFPPTSLGSSGDFAFDPSGRVSRVHIRNTLDYGVRIVGRSADVLDHVKVSVSYGCAFRTSFDSRMVSCEADFPAWHGWVVDGSSQQVVGCKFYNGGQVKTNAAAAYNFGYGIWSDGYGEIAIGGTDCQQNTGGSIRIKNGKAYNVQLASSSPGYNGSGQVRSSGAAYHVELDNTICSIFNITGQVENTGQAYRLVNGSDQNSLTLTTTAYAGSPGVAESADTVRLSNKIEVNGALINQAGVTGSVTMGSYVRKTVTTPSVLLPFASALAPTAAVVSVNLLYVARYNMPSPGMKIYQAHCRPGVVATNACTLKVGIWLDNDLSRNDTPSLLGELTALEGNTAMNMAVGGGGNNASRSTTILASPLTVPSLAFWVGFVFQGDVTGLTMQGCVGGMLAGGATFSIPGIGYQAATGVSGALPSTIFSVNMTAAPVSFSQIPTIGIGVMD